MERVGNLVDLRLLARKGSAHEAQVRAQRPRRLRVGPFGQKPSEPLQIDEDMRSEHLRHAAIVRPPVASAVVVDELPARAEVLAAWAARVRANREQVDRHREVQDGDFYAPVASTFRYQPEQTADPVLDALEAMVRPGEDLLDIGSGGGRYALPLASRARRVIALDPSPAMLAILRDGIAATHATNVEAIMARWPMADPPTADVTLIAHVAYDIEEIGPFLDAMERAARRLCVAVLFELPPPHAIDALWPAIHGEPRATLPALPEFLALQVARGRLCDVRLVRLPAAPVDPDAFLARARRLLWLREDSEKDRALRDSLHRELPQPRNPQIGVVSWSIST